MDYDESKYSYNQKKSKFRQKIIVQTRKVQTKENKPK
jgi:hypothetical protein